MKWFINLSTRAKLFVDFGVVIAFLVVVIYMAEKGISTIEELQKDIFFTEIANSNDLLELRVKESDIRLELLMMMNAADRTGKEHYHLTVKNLAGDIEKFIKRLMDRNRDKSMVLQRLEK